jgi:hypothetical protein
VNPDIQALQTGGVDPIPFLTEQGEWIDSLYRRDYEFDGSHPVTLDKGTLPFADQKNTLTRSRSKVP